MGVAANVCCCEPSTASVESAVPSCSVPSVPVWDCEWRAEGIVAFVPLVSARLVRRGASVAAAAFSSAPPSLSCIASTVCAEAFCEPVCCCCWSPPLQPAVRGLLPPPPPAALPAPDPLAFVGVGVAAAVPEIGGMPWGTTAPDGCEGNDEKGSADSCGVESARFAKTAAAAVPAKEPGGRGP